MSHAETKFADDIISIIFGYEAELKALQVRGETSPDYVHPEGFRQIYLIGPPRVRELLGLFRYGRSYRANHGRESCADEGGEWHCYGAYVIFSPSEAKELASELNKILTAPNFRDNEYEMKTFVGGFAKALEKAAKQGRGIYAHTSD